MRNLSLFVRICLASIVLGFVRDDDLDMALRSQGSTFEKWYFVSYTPFIHVLSSFYIVQSISYNGLNLKELVGIDVFSLLANFIQTGGNMIFQIWIHLH